MPDESDDVGRGEVPLMTPPPRSPGRVADVPPHPPHVCLLGPDAEVMEADGAPDVVEGGGHGAGRSCPDDVRTLCLITTGAHLYLTIPTLMPTSRRLKPWFCSPARPLVVDFFPPLTEMDSPTETDVTITSASGAAKEILSSALNNLRKTALSEQEGQSKLFFPNGIELVSITVQVATVKVEFEVAGEKGLREGISVVTDYQGEEVDEDLP